MFLQKADMFKVYEDLLAIKDIYRVLNEIYEMELDECVDICIKEMEESIDQLNKEIMAYSSQYQFFSSFSNVTDEFKSIAVISFCFL